MQSTCLRTAGWWSPGRRAARKFGSGARTTGGSCRGGARSVRNLRFTADGQHYLTREKDTVRVWDTATHTEVIPRLSHPNLDWADFSPDGRRVLTSGEGYTLIWEAATGQRLGPRLPQPVLQPAPLSPDGRRILTRAGVELVQVWSATTGAALTSVLRHSGPVAGAFFTRDGARVTSVGVDGSMRLWDGLTDRDATTPLPPSTEDAREAAFSPDGLWVATPGPGKHARVWDARTRRPVSPLLVHSARVVSVLFHADGRKLITGGLDGMVRHWDTRTWRPAGKPFSHGGHPPRLARTSDGNYLLVAAGAQVWLHQGGSCTALPVRLDHGAPILHLAVSPTGRLAATTGRNGLVRLWSLPEGRLAGPPLRLGSPVQHAAFSLDGKRVATGCADGTACVWEVGTGRRLFAPIRQRSELLERAPEGSAGPTGVLHVEFNREGTRLATAGPDLVARVWDATTGRPVTPPIRHERPVHQVRFLGADGALLTLAEDRSRLWDAATGQALTEPLTLQKQANVSPDGQRVVTFGSDEPRLWEVPHYAGDSNNLRRLAEFLAGRRVEAPLVASPLHPAELRRGAKEFHRQPAPGSPRPSSFAVLAEIAERERDWEAATFHLGEWLRREPDDYRLYERRGHAHAERAAWKAAVEDFNAAIGAGAGERLLWYHRALALLARGDLAGYRQNCEEMFQRFGGFRPAARRDNSLTLWTCMLAPGALDDPGVLVELADRWVKVEPTHDSHLQNLGAALYRAGRYGAAGQRIRAGISRRRRTEVPDACFLAMIHARLGHGRLAGQWLALAHRLDAEARASLTAARLPIPWGDEVEARVLRQEAEALVKTL
ncbi:MAG: WD40 repeat domain-containing protein, partial [Armatimonadetes bacterium]|nr:WD40 repeat domain-containing protein [Armatimonadota bacterium]